MLINPKLYEINTRVWIKQFGKNATLADVPLSYFEELAARGIDLIWLMGIWKTSPEIVEQCCFTNDLVSSYLKSLPDWKKADVTGSPYAVDDYVISPELGKKKDLKRFKNELNKLGLKLILDFIPNHFSAGTKFLKTNPEMFLQADEESFEKDSFTFFREGERIFAHGRDPLFPAWTDTVQINLFNSTARNVLIEILLELTDLCDGVRCDMAMLPLNNVFHNSWIGVHGKNNVQKPREEFWKPAIEEVKKKSADFIFIGEAYWDLEWELQQLGFDFTYDKKLMERLLLNDIHSVRSHLQANKSYQEKSVRFIENHDEARAVINFGKTRSLAAATVISTIVGMKLYHDGQFSGRRIKLPVQLCRAPEEKVSLTVIKHYEKLLEITRHEVFKCGEWKLLEPLQSDKNNFTCNSFLTWQWKLQNELRLIVINYSDSTAQCRLKFQFETDKHKLVLHDLLTNRKYYRLVEEIKTVGLFIELKSFNSHIFSIDL